MDLLRLLCLALIISVLMCTVALAIQPQADTLKVILDEVRIEAARLTESQTQAPFAFSLKNLNIQSRQASQGLALTEPLAGLPGIWINDRHNMALGERISIRGMGWRAAFGVRGIYVMLDGIPLTMPDGQTIMSLMDPAMISDVELIRGPSSVFWGNAGGGALLLSTSNRFVDPYVRTRFAAGSFGYYKAEFDTGFISDGNRYQVFGSHTSLDGFRDHSRFEAYRFGGHADLRLTNASRLKITSSILESPVSDNPGSLTADDASNNPEMAHPANVNQNARKMTRHGQFGLQYDTFFDRGELRLNAYGIGRRLQNPLSFAWIQVDRLAGGLRATYNHRFDALDLGLGADAGLQRDTRRNWANAQGNKGSLRLNQLEEVYNTALFARLRIPFGNLSISGGLRVDRLEFRNSDQFFDDGDDNSGSRSFMAISPMIGFAYGKNDWISYINFSTGFESPTTTELVNRPDMTGGFNPDLQPERSYSIETGIRTSIESINLSVDAAVFYTMVENLLSPFRTEAGGDRDFYRNVGGTRQFGVELQTEWKPSSQTEINFSYTYSKFRFGDNDGLEGNHLPGIPAHRAYASVFYHLNPFRLKAETNYADSYFVDNSNTEQNDAHLIINLNVSAPDLNLSQTLSLSPFFQLNNVLDARYNSSVIINAFGGRYYEPAPGINVVGGISLNF